MKGDLTMTASDKFEHSTVHKDKEMPWLTRNCVWFSFAVSLLVAVMIGYFIETEYDAHKQFYAFMGAVIFFYVLSIPLMRRRKKWYKDAPTSKSSISNP